jgi:hypothetical protein
MRHPYYRRGSVIMHYRRVRRGGSRHCAGLCQAWRVQWPSRPGPGCLAITGRMAPLMHGPESTVSSSGPTHTVAGSPLPDSASPVFSALPYRGAGAKQRTLQDKERNGMQPEGISRHGPTG